MRPKDLYRVDFDTTGAILVWASDEQSARDEAMDAMCKFYDTQVRELSIEDSYVIVQDPDNIERA